MGSKSEIFINRKETLVAKVLVDSPRVLNSLGIFSYSIPEKLKTSLSVGALVSVPFGRNISRGFVIELSANNLNNEFKLKDIIEIIEPCLFSEKYFELISWVSDFYLCDLLTTIKRILPVTLLKRYQKRACLCPDTEKRLKDFKLNEHEILILELLKKSAKKELSVKYLKDKSKLSSVNKILNKLQEKELIKVFEEATKRNMRLGKKSKSLNTSLKTNLKSLTLEQENIFSQIKNFIDEEKHEEFLIRGVTGSGKTEIYLKAIEKVLQKKKQVIYLLPEIALSTQLYERIKSAFPNTKILLWHSNLSDSERLDSWRESLEDEAMIILGARSAVFAPVKNLGLIIIDEEHDSSYKSGNKPFYDARIVAMKRTSASSAVLISGSATPSVFSYHRAKDKKHLLTLENRFGASVLPEVKIIDMSEELLQGNKSLFSRALRKALESCIEKKEQAILLLNKRGHSNYVFCLDCHHVFFCESCSVALVYHSSDERLLCHHCGASIPLPTYCPECKSKRLMYKGFGTQKIEAELKKLFPSTKVLRLDRDITSRSDGIKNVWEDLNNKSSNSSSEILIGTQLVAKGIDLERVTLVGVINAESGLYFPDYSGSETTFQLLTQAAGRAGRREKIGKVIFQTFMPDNKILKLASKHDYEKFFESEIEERKKLSYPPFAHLMRIIISSKTDESAQNFTNSLCSFIKENFNLSSEKILLLGPTACPLEKLQNFYRYHFVLKCKSLSKLNKFGKDIIKILQTEKNFRGLDIRFNIDLMPISLV